MAKFNRLYQNETLIGTGTYKFKRYSVEEPTSSTLTDLTGTTWLLNETLSALSTSSYTSYIISFYTAGNEWMDGVENSYICGYNNYIGIEGNSWVEVITGEGGWIYYTDGSDESLNGPNVGYDDLQDYDDFEMVDKTSEEGVARRTITITGGDDVKNASLIAWFQENATLQSGGGSVKTYGITYIYNDTSSKITAEDRVSAPPTTIEEGGSVTLYVYSYAGSTEISVENATQSTFFTSGGKFIISNPTGDVTITCTSYNVS